MEVLRFFVFSFYSKTCKTFLAIGSKSQKCDSASLIFANAKLQSFAIGNRALMFASLTCAIYFLLDSLAIEYYKYARRKERGLIRRETFTRVGYEILHNTLGSGKRWVLAPRYALLRGYPPPPI